MYQRIQANITGFKGEPVSLFSVYDTVNGILSVAKITRYSSEKKDQCLLVTNDVKEPYRDMYFDMKDFRSSIEAFHILSNGIACDKVTRRLQIDSSANASNPSAVIDLDAIEASGLKYRIDPELSNAQVACLATCFYAVQVNAISESVSFSQELERVQKNEYGVGEEDYFYLITV